LADAQILYHAFWGTQILFLGLEDFFSFVVIQRTMALSKQLLLLLLVAVAWTGQHHGVFSFGPTSLPRQFRRASHRALPRMVPNLQLKPMTPDAPSASVSSLTRRQKRKFLG
jgi:hypothetical protein